MNDLMPPPGRPVPPRMRRTVRALLAAATGNDADTGRTTMAVRLRRWGPPVAIAATVAVVAVGGVVLASGGSAGSGGDGADGTDGMAPADGSGGPTPAPPSPPGDPTPPGEPSTAPPGPTPTPGPSSEPPSSLPDDGYTPTTPSTTGPTLTIPPNPPTTDPYTPPTAPSGPPDPEPAPVEQIPPGTGTVSEPMSSPDADFEQCADLVHRQGGDSGRSAGDLGGIVAAQAADGGPDLHTVVVGNDSTVWACNLDPDRAVSRAADATPPDPDEPETWALAVNDARNYGFVRGELAWAGGVLPDGVDTVTYHFPGGISTDAVVQDGHWVVQALTLHRLYGYRGSFRVELSGPGGTRTVDVPSFGHECNQVSHGC